MKKFIINVNGKSYDVEVCEVSDNGATVAAPVMNAAPVAAPQAPKAAAPQAPANGTEVASPMPGTILKVNVSVGSTVNEGDAVAVLEAMKMENDIPAPADGTVASINVQKGSSVNANDVIITLN